MAEMTKDGIDLEIGVIEKDAIDRMLEKIPIDELVRDYLGDTKAERLNELYEELEKLNEATIDRVLKATPVEVKTKQMLVCDKAEVCRNKECPHAKRHMASRYCATDECQCGFDMAARCQEKIELIECPECGDECGGKLDIMAVHRYEITQDDKGRFSKTDGEVEYRCSKSGCELHTSQIEDALRQVDEL